MLETGACSIHRVVGWCRFGWEFVQAAVNIRIAISVWITSPSVSSAHILVVEEETFFGGEAGLFEANLMNTKLYVFVKATFNRTSHG